MYLRWLRRQLAPLCHERCSHLAIEVCLPILFAVECVKDCELTGSFFGCVPVQGASFLLYQWKRRSKELSNFAFFARLGFQRHVERKFGHDNISLRIAG